VSELGVDDVCDNAAALGGWCNDFGWIMETAINGTVDEMIDMVSSLVAEMVVAADERRAAPR